MKEWMIDPKVPLEEQVAQLIREKEQLKVENRQLKRKTRYGLVWEDHPEKLDNPNVYPLLKKDKALSIHAAEDKPLNYLIEGDNYHALQALERTHKGKIDVIYIDPPYNTGNEFIYNDKLVDKEDGFRHSKWLSFMYKRLRLAKKLLADDGVIFVSIDDNEQAQLKLLMDKVFGEENFVGTLHWRKTGQQQNNGKNLAVVMEYIQVYTKQLQGIKGVKQVIKGEYIKDRKGINAYNKRDKKGRFRLNPIKDGSLGKHTYTIKHPKTGLAITSDKWRITKERYMELKKRDMIYWTEKLPNIKKYLDENKRVLMSNFIEGIYNESSNKEIRELFGDRVFEYAKPTMLIKKLIEVIGKKEITVLDFFAGSGTTGHAVMELNEEDGGNRQFILCTNNEVSESKEREYLAAEGYIEKPHKRLYNKFKKEHPEQYEAFLRSEEYQQLGIARAVTRERLKRVIEGYTTPKGKEVKGLPNNLVYLKTVEGHAAFFRTVFSNGSYKEGMSDD